MLALFADGARAFNSRELESAAEGIADWAAATMRCKSGEMRGAFYSSLDADSEGGEGAFYVWEKNELESGMSEAESAVLGRRILVCMPGRILKAAFIWRGGRPLRKPPPH